LYWNILGKFLENSAVLNLNYRISDMGEIVEAPFEEAELFCTMLNIIGNGFGDKEALRLLSGIHAFVTFILYYRNYKWKDYFLLS